MSIPPRSRGIKTIRAKRSAVARHVLLPAQAVIHHACSGQRSEAAGRRRGCARLGQLALERNLSLIPEHDDG
jgi:hypothetical protein